jgi:putative membrane protein
MGGRMSDLKDPRVLFAAERTLMSWNRTCSSLMGFGFVIERFGLFLQISLGEQLKTFQRHFSFSIGVTFVLLAALLAFHSVFQHKKVLRTLTPAEIPQGYNLHVGMLTNAIIGFLGLLLTVHLLTGFL